MPVFSKPVTTMRLHDKLIADMTAFTDGSNPTAPADLVALVNKYDGVDEEFLVQFKKLFVSKIEAVVTPFLAEEIAAEELPDYVKMFQEMLANQRWLKPSFALAGDTIILCISVHVTSDQKLMKLAAKCGFPRGFHWLATITDAKCAEARDDFILKESLHRQCTEIFDQLKNSALTPEELLTLQGELAPLLAELRDATTTHPTHEASFWEQLTAEVTERFTEARWYAWGFDLKGANDKQRGSKFERAQLELLFNGEDPVVGCTSGNKMSGSLGGTGGLMTTNAAGQELFFWISLTKNSTNWEFCKRMMETFPGMTWEMVIGMAKQKKCWWFEVMADNTHGYPGPLKPLAMNTITNYTFDLESQLSASEWKVWLSTDTSAVVSAGESKGEDEGEAPEPTRATLPLHQNGMVLNRLPRAEQEDVAAKFGFEVVPAMEMDPEVALEFVSELMQQRNFMCVEMIAHLYVKYLKKPITEVRRWMHHSWSHNIFEGMMIFLRFASGKSTTIKVKGPGYQCLTGARNLMAKMDDLSEIFGPEFALSLCTTLARFCEGDDDERWAYAEMLVKAYLQRAKEVVDLNDGEMPERSPELHLVLAGLYTHGGLHDFSNPAKLEEMAAEYGDLPIPKINGVQPLILLFLGGIGAGKTTNAHLVYSWLCRLIGTENVAFLDGDAGNEECGIYSQLNTGAERNGCFAAHVAALASTHAITVVALGGQIRGRGRASALSGLEKIQQFMLDGRQPTYQVVLTTPTTETDLEAGVVPGRLTPLKKEEAASVIDASFDIDAIESAIGFRASQDRPDAAIWAGFLKGKKIAGFAENRKVAEEAIEAGFPFYVMNGPARVSSPPELVFKPTQEFVDAVKSEKVGQPSGVPLAIQLNAFGLQVVSTSSAKGSQKPIAGHLTYAHMCDGERKDGEPGTKIVLDLVAFVKEMTETIGLEHIGRLMKFHVAEVHVVNAGSGATMVHTDLGKKHDSFRLGYYPDCAMTAHGDFSAKAFPHQTIKNRLNLMIGGKKCQVTIPAVSSNQLLAAWALHQESDSSPETVTIKGCNFRAGKETWKGDVVIDITVPTMKETLTAEVRGPWAY